MECNKVPFCEILILKLPEKNRLQYFCVLKTDELRSKKPLVRGTEILSLLSTDDNTSTTKVFTRHTFVHRLTIGYRLYRFTGDVATKICY